MGGQAYNPTGSRKILACAVLFDVIVVFDGRHFGVELGDRENGRVMEKGSRSPVSFASLCLSDAGAGLGAAGWTWGPLSSETLSRKLRLSVVGTGG